MPQLIRFDRCTNVRLFLGHTSKHVSVIQLRGKRWVVRDQVIVVFTEISIRAFSTQLQFQVFPFLTRFSCAAVLLLPNAGL